MLEKPGTKKHKYPQFLAHDVPVFTFSGLYILENKIDRKQQRLFLVVVIMMLIFVTFFNLYPFWMQQAIWQVFCGLVLGLIAIAIIRVLVYGLASHFGLTLWLFPNFRKWYSHPTKALWPLISFETKSNIFTPHAVIFRLVSLSFIGYIFYSFMQDEQKVEDLKTFAK